MSPIRTFAAALLVATGLALAAGPALAATGDEMTRMSTLSLSATGEALATPDRASISIGVTTQSRTAADAMRQNRDAMTAVLNTVRGAGIVARDIQTASINLNPQYVYEQNQPPRLTGYQAYNRLTVIVRDLSRLGPVIDAVTASGATEIGGITFSIADPKAAEDEARRQAVKTLAERAELYAAAEGLHVARLINLTEGAPAEPRPGEIIVTAARRLAANAPTPVATGELAVRVQVSAVYELTR